MAIQLAGQPQPLGPGLPQKQNPLQPAGAIGLAPAPATNAGTMTAGNVPGISGRVTPNNSAPAAAPPPASTPTPGAPPPAPIPLATSSGASPYATASTNTPGGAFDYLTKTIAPGAGVDRLALAKSNFQNFKDSTEPEYEATLRKAGQSGAAAGQVGSGMLRGTLGDIGLSRTRDLQSAQTGFLNDATNGSIDDNYKNIGIAQQQQGFQSGQQQNAFGQGVTQAQLEEMLKSGAFGRASTTAGLGFEGNPSDTALSLSGYYGNQAGQAGAGAADLFKNSYASKALKAA